MQSAAISKSINLGTTFSHTEVLSKTYMPGMILSASVLIVLALMGCISNMSISKGAQALKELNKSWMMKFNSSVLPLVQGISNLSLETAEKNDPMPDVLMPSPSIFNFSSDLTAGS
jgi:hypothetical protein